MLKVKYILLLAAGVLGHPGLSGQSRLRTDVLVIGGGTGGTAAACSRPDWVCAPC